MALYDDFRAAMTRAAEPVRAAVDGLVALADRRRKDGTVSAPGSFEQRVAPEPSIDRWPVVLGSQVTFQYIASVLRLCQNGYRQQFVDLLDEVLERDPHLYAVLQQRILAVAGGHVELVPPPALTKGSPEAERAAEICADVRKRIAAIPNLVQALARLLWGLYYGITAAEIVWDLRADGWHVQSLGYVHSRRLAYPDQNVWDLHIWDQGPVQPLTGFGAFPTERFYGLRIRDYPGKFLVFAPSLRGDYPTREGLGRQVVFYSAMKNMGVRGIGQFVERYAKPFAFAYYNTKTQESAGNPRVADKPDIDAADAALKALGIGSLSAATLPDSIEIKLDGPAIKGGGSSPTHIDLINLCNAEISKAVRGGTLTTDAGEKGARSLGEVHAEGDARNARYDAVCLADALQPLADWLTRLNYPGELELTPLVKVEVEQKTPEQLLDMAVKAAGANVPVDADKLGEKLPFLSLTDPENPKARRMAPLKPADLFALDPGTPANIPRALEALAELVGLHLTPGQISSLAELPRDETAQFVSDLLARVKQDAAASSMLSPSPNAPTAPNASGTPPKPGKGKAKPGTPENAGSPEAPEAADDADAQEPVGGDAEGAANVDLRATGSVFVGE